MLPNAVLFLLSTLNNAGYEAFTVGGCVRDMLRGVAPSDFDITTNATPEDVMALFADHHVIPTGLQHGTVTVVVDGAPFEITTYRIDGTYSDSRRPDHIRFTSSLEKDLERRDFTINAMAYHPDKGIIDPFNGQADLQAHILRCVGDARTRFSEDALRIARLLRFMSVLESEADDDTAAAAHALCDRLDNVAAERKRIELTKLLQGDGFLNVATQFPDVMCRLVPSLTPLCGFDQKNPHHDFDIYTHSMRAVQFSPKDGVVRLAALFHDVGKPSVFSVDDSGIGHFYGHAVHSEDIAKTALRALRFDNATIRQVLPLIRHHDTELVPSRRSINRRLATLGEATFRRLIDLRTADVLAQRTASVAPDLSEILALLEEILSEQACLSLADLAVNGNDLLSIGYPPNPRIGEMLRSLLDGVLAEEFPNERDCLLQIVKERWPLV